MGDQELVRGNSETMIDREGGIRNEISGNLQSDDAVISNLAGYRNTIGYGHACFDGG